MDSMKNYVKKFFWPVFVVIFVLVTVFVALNVFSYIYDSIYENEVNKALNELGLEDNEELIEAINESTESNNVFGSFSPNVNKTTSGVISKNEIWRNEIHITGDIIVLKGVTLIIEPGTKVLIAANSDSHNLNSADSFNMKKGINETNTADKYIHPGEPYNDEGNHISIIIFGRLEAVGTEEEMISITSDSLNPTRYDWTGLRFGEGIFSFVEMKHYRGFDPGNKTEVSHSILSEVGGCAICFNNGKSAEVKFNTVFDASHELIDIHDSSPVIQNNVLGPNPDRAGIIIDGGSATITNNTIKGCGQGILFISEPENALIENNEFLNNEEDILYAT
jgi:parallel beta-helix repeat protein